MKRIIETERLVLREYVQEDFDALYAHRAAPFVAAGLLLDDGERIAFTPRGFDLSNAVLCELIGE